MRMHTYLTMALVPAALVAQSPTVPNYDAVLKATTPEVEGQLKAFHPLEALQKAESALPATLPAFDKSSAPASLRASVSFSGITRLYHLAAIAAGQAGDWDKVLDYLVKEQDCAKQNYENTNAALTPLIAAWTQALDKSQKVVTDNAEHVKALQAKPGRTPQEEQETQTFLAKDALWRTSKDKAEKNDAAKYLKTNQPHFLELQAKAVTPEEQQEIDAYKIAQTNLTQGPKTVKTLQENIDATKTELDSCPGRIETIKRNLKEEADEETAALAAFKVKGKPPIKETSGPKFEQKKALYYESVLTTESNYTSRPAKQDRLNFAFRLRHKVAGTALQSKVEEVIERLRQDQPPIPPPPGAKKAAKGKKA